MSKVQTSLRLEEETFKEAKEILNALGMNFTQAVNIFASMVVQEKGLPFVVKLPSKETLKAMQEVENRETESISFDELKKEMKLCLK